MSLTFKSLQSRAKKAKLTLKKEKFYFTLQGKVDGANQHGIFMSLEAVKLGIESVERMREMGL